MPGGSAHIKSAVASVSKLSCGKGGFLQENCVDLCGHKMGVKFEGLNKMCGMGIILERFTFWYLFVIRKPMKIAWNVYNFGKFTVSVQKVQIFLFIGDLKVHENCVEWV